jgi:hypothetical protein
MRAGQFKGPMDSLRLGESVRLTPHHSSFLGALAVVAIGLSAGRASADVLPPDLCESAGQACNSAKDSQGAYTAAGTCVNATCERVGELEDGGHGAIAYACTHCVSDAGSGNSPSEAGADGAAASSDDGSQDSGGGGCAVSGPVGTVAPAALIAAGAALLFVSRRRRDSR